MPEAEKETRHVCILPAGEQYLTDWQPWINCPIADSLEQTVSLALNRYLREAGYQHQLHGAVASFDAFELVAYVATPRDVWINDRPRSCRSFRIQVGPA